MYADRYTPFENLIILEIFFKGVVKSGSITMSYIDVDGLHITICFRTCVINSVYFVSIVPLFIQRQYTSNMSVVSSVKTMSSKLSKEPF